MTELTTIATTQSFFTHKKGSVGKLLPGSAIKVGISYTKLLN